MPLHLDYRPVDLAGFYGNDSVKDALATILARTDRPQAFLLVGPSGCGKTTLARILVRALGCADMDYKELNISDARGIDDARQLLADANFLPLGGGVKVFCLDECQQATSAFQQAMLKALEDTPKHVVYILCTTDPQKLVKTVRTRCSTFALKPLSGPVMRELLSFVLAKEGVQGFPAAALDEVVVAADGSPRQALVVLDQVIDIADNDKLLKAIRKARPSDKTVLDLCQVLHRGEASGWKAVAEVIEDLGTDEDWERVRMAVLGWAVKVALSGKGVGQAAVMLDAFSEPWFNTGRAGLVLACYRCVV